MDEHLKNIFKWIREKFPEDDPVLELFADFSVHFKDDDTQEDLFMFDNILKVTEKDVKNWKLENVNKWLDGLL